MTLSLMDQMNDLQILTNFLVEYTPYGDSIEDEIANMNIVDALNHATVLYSEAFIHYINE